MPRNFCGKSFRLSLKNEASPPVSASPCSKFKFWKKRNLEHPYRVFPPRPWGAVIEACAYGSKGHFFSPPRDIRRWRNNPTAKIKVGPFFVRTSIGVWRWPKSFFLKNNWYFSGWTPNTPMLPETFAPRRVNTKTWFWGERDLVLVWPLSFYCTKNTFRLLLLFYLTFKIKRIFKISLPGPLL